MYLKSDGIRVVKEDVDLEYWMFVVCCNKFYFAIEFEVRMWVWIYQKFEKDQIPIYQTSQSQILINQNIFELDRI